MKNFFKRMTVLLSLLAALSFMLTLTDCAEGWVDIYIANESDADIKVVITHLQKVNDDNTQTLATVFDETIKAGEIGNYSTSGLANLGGKYKFTVTYKSVNFNHPDKLGNTWELINGEYILIFDGDNLKQGSKSDL